MQINVCFDIAALFVLLITFVFFGSRRKAALSLYRIYYVGLIVMIAMTLVDMLTVSFRVWPDLVSREIGGSSSS